MKLSIITINYNNADGLRRTIESIVSQTFTDFEYIVIDGGSIDDSVDIIKQYESKITYWVSEPDKGIYNAMNRGILKATGEYCLFLNSGDWLVDKDVVIDFVNQNFEDEIISGNIILFVNENSELRSAIKKEDLGFEHLFNNRIPHPATFIKRSLFEKYGLYNENLKIVSDWEFFLKCLVLENCTYNNFDRVVSYFDMSGISSLPQNMDLQLNEREFVLQKYLPLVNKSYTRMIEELQILQLHENDYKEYMNLKNGKFSLIIKLLLYVKRVIK